MPFDQGFMIYNFVNFIPIKTKIMYFNLKK